MHQDAFRELIRRVRAGDDRAAAELVREYEPAIRRAVRLRLRDPRLRRRLDSLDVCQSVLGSFFCHAALGEFDLDSPEALLKLLTRLVRHKLADHAQRQGAAKRDYRREAGGLERDVAAPSPTPSRQLAARELLQQVRDRLSEEERRLLDLRQQGREWAEIAAELGGSAEALRKQLARALDRVAEALDLGELRPR
jgi:RNA polymerase sigma-70 factor (ECF subfamily)